jgi:putative glycosyltransferase (TIGR04372 family)
MPDLGEINWDYLIPGATPEKPFRIVALLNSRAVGDTIFYHIFCASVKRLFDHASLTIYQRDDREYKIDLLNMNHDKDKIIFAKPSFPGISIDSFQNVYDYPASGQPIPSYVFRKDYWKNSGSDRPDLILSPEGMPENMLPCFENPAFLKIPDSKFDPLDAELLSHGLEPNRWFCVLNYREPGYKYRPVRPTRDLDPKRFKALVDYIIDNLGGQVLRVGHPQMTPFPNRPGFIDLAGVENNFMLHAHAITRARYMIGSLTGISHLGSAVNTPTVITNCVDPPYFPGCWRDHDIALFTNLYEPGGRRISITEQCEKSFLGVRKLVDLANNHGYRAEQNSLAELKMVTNAMMETTMDCQSWRIPQYPKDPVKRPNRFDFPMRLRVRPRILEFGITDND